MVKRGRPKKRETREVVLTIRLTETERAELDAAAERARLPISLWARKTLLDVADPRNGKKK